MTPTEIRNALQQVCPQALKVAEETPPALFDAFCAAMADRRYGPEETENAFAWFVDGYLAASCDAVDRLSSIIQHHTRR